jgi:serine/threonine-protein kinase
MDADHDLLFAVLAFRAELMDAARFAEACAAWSVRREEPMAELLVRRGWITAADRAALEHLLAVKITRHAGSARAALAEVEDDRIWRVLTSVAGGEPGAMPTALRTSDPGVTRVATDRDLESPEARGHVLLSVVPFAAETHERYTLTRLHARGGIGQVWLARDSALGREVALKELRPERANNPDLWARFLEEARITGQLEHPSIVPVYELARRADDQYPFYTMRFVRGRSLTEAAHDYHNRRREGRAEALELPTLLTSFVGICQAVAFAHSRGVIHRDLKGQNVVLGDYGEVILLDWGLAKVVNSSDPASATVVQPVAPVPQGADSRDATQPGQVLGTPAYMSPEQAAGRFDQVDRRSDVYGLGAILYEILTGQPPFSGSGTDELLRRVREEEPTAPRRVNPEAPAALAAVCKKAIAKVPAARYGSAAELAHEVQRFLADEPVAAYRDPMPVRAGRWARRHRTMVAAAAVLLVSAVVALAAGGWLVARERDEARRQGRFARRAVDDMYTQVAERWLADQPHMDPLQRQFLEKALDYYVRFAQLTSTDLAVRREKGQAYHHMGDILRKLGRQDEAEKAYRRAIELLDHLAREAPREGRYRHELAHAHNRLGIVLAATGRRVEAEAEYERALDLQEPLAAWDPRRAEYRHYLAKTYKNRADLLESSGRHKEAEASYGRANALLEQLASDKVGTDEYREDLAASLLGIGRVMQRQDRRSAAFAAYRRGTELLERLVAEAPVMPRRREFLAIARMTQGTFLVSGGRISEAEPALARSLAVYEALVRDFPARPDYQSGVPRAESNLGQLYWTSGRSSEAEAAFRRAVKGYSAVIAKDAPGATQNRVELARCQNNLGLVLAAAGRRPEAEQAYQAVLLIYRELAAAEPTVPQRRRDLGGALGNFGLLLAGSGRLRDAEAVILEAQTLFEKLAAEYPDVPDYRWALAWSFALQANLGGPETETAARRAVGIYEALVREVPAVLAYRVELAQIANNLGDYLKNQNRALEAEPVLRNAHAAARKLVVDFPDVPDHWGLLGQVLWTWGELKQKSGALLEARPLLESAAAELRRAAAQQPDRRDHRAALRDVDLALAHVLYVLGQAERPADERTKLLAAMQDLAEELPRVALDRAGGCVDSARVLALCGALAERTPRERGDSFADSAMVRLREAVAAGFTAMGRVAADTDFAVVSGREDFKELTRR